MDLAERIAAFQRFCGPDLTRTVAGLEAALQGATADDLQSLLGGTEATDDAIAGAGELKRIAGQLYVAIHALGILLCLPHLLEPGETVEYVSLGAGNTGRAFDLETDRRIAEFKFVRWRGGSESIRQNALFKDFFLLAEHPTPKRKYIYVLETERPLKFLNGGRALRSVLKDAPLAATFREKYGDRYERVRDYFQPRRESVTIQDISGLLPGLSGLPVVEEEPPD
ncbi:MAG TPA: hypothetical protein VF746_31485 [Longimicrobium sp.]|jgi:hypothetical protein